MRDPPAAPHARPAAEHGRASKRRCRRQRRQQHRETRTAASRPNRPRSSARRAAMPDGSRREDRTGGQTEQVGTARSSRSRSRVPRPGMCHRPHRCPGQGPGRAAVGHGGQPVRRTAAHAGSVATQCHSATRGRASRPRCHGATETRPHRGVALPAAGARRDRDPGPTATVLEPWPGTGARASRYRAAPPENAGCLPPFPCRHSGPESWQPLRRRARGQRVDELPCRHELLAAP